MKDPYIQLLFRIPARESFAGSNAIYMRSDEMYLIEAEAYAHGAAGDANLTFSKLVKTSNPAFLSPGAGGILAEILLQRRIALWAEGLRYADIQRLKLPLDRTGSSHDSGSAIKKGSYLRKVMRFCLKIPQAGFDANKALTFAD